MPIRDHIPVVIDKFNGLWSKNDPESVPLDHFDDCENIRFIGDSTSFATRFGIGVHQTTAAPLKNILRIYNYPTQTANTLLVLVQNGANGEIYHVTAPNTTLGPILTIAGMVDFGFVPYAGRAYITPIGYFTTGSLNIEKGLQSQFLYVYLGAGAAARKAAGPTPAGTLTIANGAAGYTDAGVHVFGVVGETDTGYLSPPVALNSFTTGAALSVSFTTIPLFSGTYWVKRHIVASIIIQNYNGDTTGYQLFFIPNATINDNTSTTLSNISFYDADLLDDASHLLENYSEIPAGVGLAIYHNRLCLYTTYTDISLILVSEVGEPEAINQLSGLLIPPLDGNPITNAQQLRDVLYVFKRNRTISFVDNGDVPSSWPLTVIDQGLGAPIHGLSTVLDSGSANVDYLITSSYSGINIFNGRYLNPELSWKISSYWLALDRNEFRSIQILNDTINQVIYVVLPTKKVLVGDYKNGLDPKKIRWTPWKFDFRVNTVAQVNIDTLIFGSDRRLV